MVSCADDLITLLPLGWVGALCINSAVLSSCKYECGYIVLLVQVIHIVKMIIEIGCRREMFFCQQVADAIDMVRYYYKKEVEANMAARKAGA